MKKLLYILLLIIAGCNTIPKSVPITVEDLMKRSREAYDLGDKLVGQIDSLQEVTFPYNSFPGTKRENSYKTKLLVIVSKDSSGHRQKVIQYLDSLTITK